MIAAIKQPANTVPNPTPEEIEERAAEVRAKWTEVQLRQRIVQQSSEVGIRQWSGRVRIEE